MSVSGKTKTALDEVRTLMLGAQILLGFQLQAPFQSAFSELPELEKSFQLLVLILLVAVVGLLISPAAHHRIVEEGQASEGLIRFISGLAVTTLAPFAIALSLDIQVAASGVIGLAGALGLGAVTAAAAIALWYGPFLKSAKAVGEMATSDEKTPTAAKIDFALTEARVVLPGAQALLGFQLAIMLTTGFAELPQIDRSIHLIALCLIALCTMFLMAPAAYHRIVYDGEATEEFYRIASRFILAATVLLACGLALDLRVVASRASGNVSVGNAIAVTSFCVLVGLWHAWPCWRRARRGARSP